MLRMSCCRSHHSFHPTSLSFLSHSPAHKDSFAFFLGARRHQIYMEAADHWEVRHGKHNNYSRAARGKAAHLIGMAKSSS